MPRPRPAKGRRPRADGDGGSGQPESTGNLIREIGGQRREEFLKYFRELPSSECEELLTVDHDQLLFLRAKLLLEADADTMVDMEPAILLTQDRVKEIVATFLDAMVYREGVVAVPSDPDNPLASFNNVLVLRSLEDNIEKRLEMQAASQSVLWVSLYLSWNLIESWWFWPVCCCIAALIFLDSEQPFVGTVKNSINHAIRMMFRNDPSSLVIIEKCRGLASAALVMVAMRHNWYTAGWILTIIPVLFAFASSTQKFGLSLTFGRIHIIVRYLCRGCLLLATAYQGFRSYSTLLLALQTFAPRLLTPLLQFAMLGGLFISTMLLKIPKLILPENTYRKMDLYRCRNPYSAACINLLLGAVVTWCCWDVPPPWSMPLYGVIALVAVMSCEDAVQTKVQEIVVILTLLPLLLVVYGWELLKRKLKVGPQQPEKPRDDTE